MVSASSGEGLRANQPVFFNGRWGWAENQFCRSGSEVLEPQDREVFMVKSFVIQHNRWYLADSPLRTIKPETEKRLLFVRREESKACCRHRGRRQRPSWPYFWRCLLCMLQSIGRYCIEIRELRRVKDMILIYEPYLSGGARGTFCQSSIREMNVSSELLTNGSNRLRRRITCRHLVSRKERY